MPRNRLGVSATVVALVLLVACGGGDDDPAPTPVPPTATAAPIRTATAIPPTAIPTVAPSPAPAPTATSTPAPTATPTPEPTATPSPLGGEFFLERVQPAEPELFTDSSTLEIVGRTRVDAVVTVNDDVVEPDADGVFRHSVSLEFGANIIEIVASVASDEQDSFVVTAVYLP